MRFLIKQKYFSIKDGFHITDINGNNAYFVQGKFFTLGKQLTMFDNAGREVLFLKQRLFRLRARFDIYINNEVVAYIKRKTFFLKRYKIKSDVYGDLKIKGNIFAWNFSISTAEKRQVGVISKKIMKIRDTYTVDALDQRLEPLVIATALIIDAMHHPRH